MVGDFRLSFLGCSFLFLRLHVLCGCRGQLFLLLLIIDAVLARLRTDGLDMVSSDRRGRLLSRLGTSLLGRPTS